jgi:hypothetical protein
MEVSGQLHAPAAYLQGKDPQYPGNKRESRSGHDGEKKKKKSLLTEMQ